MAARNKYQDLLRAKVVSAIEQANTATFTHKGVKGSVLEILVGQLFEPLLPADIGVGTGQITDSYTGIISSQIDVILYDKSILPPILIDQKIGIFPVEAVLYTIEVKTVLNAGGLKSAHQCAEILATKFGYRPGQKDEAGRERNHKIEKVRSVVFALHTDLRSTGINEAERYKKLYGNGVPYLRAICVADKEYWYDNGTHWVGFKGGDRFDEILAFIGGISNTYRSVALSRGYPSLGNYIIPEPMSLMIAAFRDIPSICVICENCGLKSEMIPEIGQMNLTVNGALCAKNKCPNCGGTMKSESGIYKFEKGRLVKTAG